MAKNKSDHSSRIHKNAIPNKPGVSNWVEREGHLPAFLARVAKHIAADSHLPPGRAIAAAVSQCRKWAAQGNAQAAAAVAEWERMKAASKAKTARARNLAARRPTALELASYRAGRSMQHRENTPYSWRHGYIPLTAQTAKANRKKWRPEAAERAREQQQARTERTPKTAGKAAPKPAKAPAQAAKPAKAAAPAKRAAPAAPKLSRSEANQKQTIDAINAAGRRGWKVRRTNIGYELENKEGNVVVSVSNDDGKIGFIHAQGMGVPGGYHGTLSQKKLRELLVSEHPQQVDARWEASKVKPEEPKIGYSGMPKVPDHLLRSGITAAGRGPKWKHSRDEQGSLHEYTTDDGTTTRIRIKDGHYHWLQKDKNGKKVSEGSTSDSYEIVQTAEQGKHVKRPEPESLRPGTPKPAETEFDRRFRVESDLKTGLYDAVHNDTYENRSRWMEAGTATRGYATAYTADNGVKTRIEVKDEAYAWTQTDASGKEIASGRTTDVAEAMATARAGRHVRPPKPVKIKAGQTFTSNQGVAYRVETGQKTTQGGREGYWMVDPATGKRSFAPADVLEDMAKNKRTAAPKTAKTPAAKTPAPKTPAVPKTSDHDIARDAIGKAQDNEWSLDRGIHTYTLLDRYDPRNPNRPRREVVFQRDKDGRFVSAALYDVSPEGEMLPRREISIEEASKIITAERPKPKRKKVTLPENWKDRNAGHSDRNAPVWPRRDLGSRHASVEPEPDDEGYYAWSVYHDEGRFTEKRGRAKTPNAAIKAANTALEKLASGKMSSRRRALR